MPATVSRTPYLCLTFNLHVVIDQMGKKQRFAIDRRDSSVLDYVILINVPFPTMILLEVSIIRDYQYFYDSSDVHTSYHMS
jgi:hypothetical protein